MLPADDAYTLALLYHINSEPWMNFEAYSDPGYEMQFKRLPEAGPSYPLPGPDTASPLRSVIRKRRSCRNFVPGTMPLSQLGDILANCYGTSGLIENANGQLSYSRPVPSAGALYPLEIYVVTQSVGGVGDGVHHYNAVAHSLEQLKAGPVMQELGDGLLGQYFLENASAVVLFSAVFERTMKKYGPRGYRYILLEAGHAAQNVCLLTAELGLSSLCIGGFHDHRLNRYLGLDGKAEAVVYMVGLGYEAQGA